MRLDELVDLIERVARRMAGPRQPLARVEHGDIGRRAAFGDDEIGARLACGAACCGTMKRASSSGSATVAERPMLVRFGARRNSRAKPSESRSPRFEVTSACSSSRITRLSEPNRYGASAEASSSASCSGVVSRICGGSRRWRWRFEAGVSPVRVSMRIGRPISTTGASRLRAISTASALSGEM